MRGYSVRVSQRHLPIVRGAQAAGILRAALLEHGRLEATPPDAAALAGLPLERAQEALFQLLADYPGGVQVGERGTLTFRFASLEAPRQGKPSPLEAALAFVARNAAALEATVLLVLAPGFMLTLACHAAALGQALPMPLGLVPWAIVPLAVMLGVALMCQFLLAPLAVLTALQCVLALLLPGLFTLPAAWLWDDTMLPWTAVLLFVLLQATLGGVGTWLVLRFFVFGERNLAAMGLSQALAGTLFGPLPTPRGGLVEQRRLVALIVERRGVLTLADLMGLFGWSRHEAEGQLARILADHQGEAVVTDEGALLFRFDALRLAREGVSAADLRPSYERELAPPAFFDASRSIRVVLGGCCAIGLAGLLSHPKLPWFPPLHLWGPDGLLASFTASSVSAGLGLYPYLAIALPMLLRWPLWLVAVRRHERRLRFLNLLKLAVAPPHGRYMLTVPAGVAALGGTVDLDHVRADGRMLVKFPDHQLASAAAARLRAELALRPAGEEAVVFDTAGPDVVSGL
ncbi:MAG: hypothetical protein JWM80_5013 [Cyanobacteria bacterium RYN_339]|nr:hypothetical protein [Cyanobacteria bacterium RYN_339]